MIDHMQRMVNIKTKKQEKDKSKSSGTRSKMGPLLVLMAIFANPAAAANLLRLVRWQMASFAPVVKSQTISKNEASIRYICKDIIVKHAESFNDKTGTDLHYKHVGLGQWMMLVW